MFTSASIFYDYGSDIPTIVVIDIASDVIHKRLINELALIAMSGDDVVGAHTSVANGVCYSPSTEQTAEQELNPFPHPIFIRAEGIALDDARLAVVDNLVDVGA